VAKKKIKTDQEYQENQRDAQKQWRAKNPEYWKTYRKNHPKYVKNNREQQKQRRTKQQAAAKAQQPPKNAAPMENVAKMDLAPVQTIVQEGKCLIFRVTYSGPIAKMDLADGQVIEIRIVTQNKHEKDDVAKRGLG
jgi:hypothetical protein